MPTRRTLLLFITGVLAIGLVGTAYVWKGRDTRSAEQTKLRVRFPIPALRATMAPFVAAKQKGWYAAEGLSVEFRYGGSGTNPVSMVLNGQDDVGILGGPDTMLVADGKGADLVAIAVMHRNADFPCLITLAKSGITRLEQLAGKRVGLFPGHISTDVLRSLFRRANVSVHEVDVGYDYSQLISGQLDAQWAFTSAAAVELPEEGVPVNVISPSDYGIRTHGYTIFVQRKRLDSLRSAITGFLRATFKGVNFSHDDPAGATKFLVTEDATGNLKEAQVRKRLQELDPVTSNFNPLPPGFMDLDMFQSTYDRLRDLGLIQKPYEVNTAFDLQFLRAIHGDAMNVQPPPASSGAAGVAGGR